MKKEYMRPIAVKVNVESVSLMATSSLTINKGGTSVNSTTGQLSNRQRGEWGNLWN